MTMENRIQLIADELGLSRPKLALALGLPPHKVADAASGKVKISSDLASCIEDKFGYAYRWLMTGEGPKRREQPDREAVEGQVWRDLLSPTPREGKAGAEGVAGGQAGGVAGGASLSSDNGAAEGFERHGKAEEFVYLPLYDVKASAGPGSIPVGERIVDWFAFKRTWIHTELRASVRDLYLLFVEGDSMEPTLANGDMVMAQRLDAGQLRDGLHVVRAGAAINVKRLQFLPGGKIRVASDNATYEPYTLDLADPNARVELLGRVVWAGKRF